MAQDAAPGVLPLVAAAAEVVHTVYEKAYMRKGTMKVALVGCGRWGKNLARVFHELGVLGLVCDPVRPDLPFEFNWSPESWTPLQSDEITAFAIATPSVHHYELGMDVLRSGKDLFVEKPMTLSSADAYELVKKAEEVGAILMVGHIMEYHPVIAIMKREIQSETFGDIQFIESARYKNGRGRHDETVLWSLAPHDISLILRLMGRMPDSLMAQIIPGSASLDLDYVGLHNTHCFVHVSWVVPQPRQTLRVVGSKGVTLEFDGVTNVLTERVNDRLERRWVNTEEPLRIECQAFIDACETGVPPLANGQSGLDVIEVLEQAERSIERGTSVVV